MIKKTVLIIDDALFLRTILRRMFEEDGNFEIIGEGTDGFEAIDKARSLQPDIITMDLVMPGLDGLKAVEKIVSISPQSKIIMMSSVGNAKTINEAVKLGVYDYIVKPVTKVDLNRIINKLLNE